MEIDRLSLCCARASEPARTTSSRAPAHLHLAPARPSASTPSSDICKLKIEVEGSWRGGVEVEGSGKWRALGATRSLRAGRLAVSLFISQHPSPPTPSPPRQPPTSPPQSVSLPSSEGERVDLTRAQPQLTRDPSESRRNLHQHAHPHHRDQDRLRRACSPSCKPTPRD